MRIAIPIAAILLGVLVVLGMFYNAQQARQTTQQQSIAASPQVDEQTQPSAEALAEAPAPATSGKAAPAEAEQPAAAQDTAAAATDAPPPPLPLPAGSYTALGADEPLGRTLGESDPYRVQVTLTSYGAGVARIVLNNYKREVDSNEPFVLETILRGPAFDRVPYAARSLVINGQPVTYGFVDSAGVPGETTALMRAPWIAGEVETDAQGVQRVDYTLHVVSDAGDPVVDVVRTWVLPPDSYNIRLLQRIVNRTNRPVTVDWSHYIQGDVVDDGAAYLGDQRMFVLGYFPYWDPQRINLNAQWIGRRAMIASRLDAVNPMGLWPRADRDPGDGLAWVASENRYFALITHPRVTDAMQQPADLPVLAQQFPQVITEVFPGVVHGQALPDTMQNVIFALGTGARTIAAGGTLDADLGVFAGPRKKSVFAQRPYDVLQLGQLVRYEIGCTWLTFQWLAKALLRFLEGIHFVVRDWGVAIIILVVVVRLLLHPLTKRAQVNMMKMSKAMQAIQPEMEKLKKKYKDDQQKLQAEQMRLYKEKGVNPLNMLGCLPMFLQMPIWIALYAMLYLAIELRHEPAFYGVFQWISRGNWHFLASLSEPDYFIRLFPDPQPISLLFISFDYSAINLLPLLMGVVFWLNMKFTTPPPPPNETDEQKQMRKQQQMMMKLMPFMMPLFLYAAPSGLTLYICASTGAGILDSYMVRKHIKDLEAKGELFKPQEKKPRKPGGFMDRLQKTIEDRQRRMGGGR